MASNLTCLCLQAGVVLLPPTGARSPPLQPKQKANQTTEPKLQLWGPSLLGHQFLWGLSFVGLWGLAQQIRMHLSSSQELLVLPESSRPHRHGCALESQGRFLGLQSLGALESPRRGGALKNTGAQDPFRPIHLEPLQ